jgi:MFS family permease
VAHFPFVKPLVIFDFAYQPFALFYTFFGMPIAWLADRWNRSLIIFFGVTLWSIATVLCGMAGSYWALFAARVAVGVGEAALNPPALSLLKDYFPPDRLGRVNTN